MQNNLLLKIIYIGLIIPIIFLTFSKLNIDKIEAAEDPGNEVGIPECMAGPLSDYMNALIDAKARGDIPSNVKLLSPAFNITNPVTNNIIARMKQTGANFNGLDGIAVNVYNTSGQTSILQHIDSQNLMNTFSNNLPIHILESGRMADSGTTNQDVINQISQVFNLYGNRIRNICLFNPTNTNPQFSQHAFTPEERTQLCNTVDCGKMCINYGTHFGGQSYQDAQYWGGVLQIGLRGNSQAVKDSISRSPGRTYIRIGVGNDSGGFDDVNDYIDYLKDIGNSTTGDIYAIAGPNEPDLEFWLSESCSIYQYYYNNACEGPYNSEEILYDTEVVGSEASGVPPFKLIGSMRSKEVDELEDIPNKLTSQFVVKITSHIFPDHELISEQRIGSVDPTSPYYIGNRVDNFAWPLQLTMAVPHQPFYESFNDGRQPGQKYLETPISFTKRIVPGIENEEGTKSEMPVELIGCIQRPYCNPSKGDEGRCLRLDIDDYMSCGPDGGNCKCDDSMTAQECISFGEVFKFNGEIVLNEDTEPHSTSRIFLAAYRNFSRKLDSDRYLGPIGNQAYIPNDGKNLKDQILAENTKVNTRKDAPIENDTNYSMAEKIDTITTPSIKTVVNTAYAQAETGETPPYRDVPECNGMALLIEDKSDFYAVKAFNTTPSNCAQYVDFGYDIEYYYNGEMVQSCSSPVRKSAGLPRWNPTSAMAEEKYGMSISDMCKIPGFIKPGDEGKFEVAMKITHSSAPYQSDPNCPATPSCACPTGDLRCNKLDQNILPPVDCRKCETWANPELCDQLIASQTATKSLCIDGECTTGPIKVDAGYDYDNYDDNDSFSFNFGDVFRNIPLLGNLLRNSSMSGGCQKIKKNCDLNGENCDHDWQCSIYNQEYQLYLSPPSGIWGDLNMNRTADMRTHNDMFLVTGVNDEWFIPEPAEGTITYTLRPLSVEFEENKNSLRDDFDINEALRLFDVDGFSPDSRTVKIKYSDMYSQARIHCGANVFLSPPIQDREFPIKQMELCNEFNFVPKSIAYNLEKETIAVARNREFAKANNVEFATILEEPDLATTSPEDTNPYYTSSQTSNNKSPQTTTLVATQSMDDNSFLKIQTKDLPTRKPTEQMTSDEITKIRNSIFKDIIKVLNEYSEQIVPGKSIDFADLPKTAQAEIINIVKQYNDYYF